MIHYNNARRVWLLAQPAKFLTFSEYDKYYKYLREPLQKRKKVCCDFVPIMCQIRHRKRPHVAACVDIQQREPMHLRLKEQR